MYIFNTIKVTNCNPMHTDDCGACGSTFDDGINFLVRYGDVYQSGYGYDNSCNRYTVSREDKGAMRVTGGATVFNQDDDDELKISAVINQIYNGNPVFVSLDLPQRYGEYTFLDDPYFDGGLWVPPTSAIPNKNFAHALTVVAYDSDQRQFEIMNSWRPTWANHGFFYITFSDFLKYARYAGVVYAEATDMAVPTTSRLKIGIERYRRIQGVVQPQGQATISVENNGYTVLMPSPQLFKLNLEALPSGYNIYIMSQDSQGKSKLHFPLSTDNPYIYNDGLSLKLPTSSVLVFNQDQDQIVVVISKSSFPDALDRLTRVASDSDNLINRLTSEFGATDQTNAIVRNGKIDLQISQDTRTMVILLKLIKQTP